MSYKSITKESYQATADEFSRTCKSSHYLEFWQIFTPF